MHDLSIQTKTPTKILYHNNCPDGFASAFVFYLKYKNNCQYIPVNYNDTKIYEIIDELLPSDNVIMVDVSFDEQILIEIKKKVHDFILLDHHPIAKELSKKHSFVIFNKTFSGCVLAHNYLSNNYLFENNNKNEIPLLLKVVQARDLHQNLKDAFEILQVLDSIPYDFKSWELFNERLNDDKESIISEGSYMKYRIDALCFKLTESASPITMGGYNGLSVNAPVELGDQIGIMLAQNADFGFTWFVNKIGKVRASWRSHKIDVSKLAEKYNGGGHDFSSAAEIDLYDIKKILLNEG